MGTNCRHVMDMGKWEEHVDMGDMGTWGDMGTCEESWGHEMGTELWRQKESVDEASLKEKKVLSKGYNCIFVRRILPSEIGFKRKRDRIRKPRVRFRKRYRKRSDGGSDDIENDLNRKRRGSKSGKRYAASESDWGQKNHPHDSAD